MASMLIVLVIDSRGLNDSNVILIINGEAARGIRLLILMIILVLLFQSMRAFLRN